MTVLSPFCWQINTIVADDCAVTGSQLAHTHTPSATGVCDRQSLSVMVEDISLITSVWVSE